MGPFRTAEQAGKACGSNKNRARRIEFHRKNRESSGGLAPPFAYWGMLAFGVDTRVGV
jgi:hypothetical protein